MDNWTIEMVEARLEEAASVMKRLPPVRVPGYFSTWPRTLVEFADRVGQQPEPMRLPPPSPAAITRMEQALDWLRWLEPQDAKLVWARANGARWKNICWTIGLTRSSAHIHWRYALSVIVLRLSKKNIPSKRSRQFIVARAQTDVP